MVGETGMNIFSYTCLIYVVQIRADVEMPYLITQVTHRSEVMMVMWGRMYVKVVGFY